MGHQYHFYGCPVTSDHIAALRELTRWATADIT
jgi:hypothetical protein